MQVESLMLAQSRLFDFQECLRLYFGCEITNPSLAGSPIWFTRVQIAWRAFEELEKPKDLDSLKAKIVTLDKINAETEPESLSLLLHLKAKILAENQEWDRALELFNKALECAPNVDLKIKNKIGISVVLFFKNQLAHSQRQLEETLTLAKHEQSFAHENQIVCCLWLAQVHNALCHLETAMLFLNEALALANEERNIYLIVKGQLVAIEFALLKNDMFAAETALIIAESIIPKRIQSKSLRKLQELQQRLNNVKGRAGFKSIESESRTIIVNPHQEKLRISDYPILQKLLNALWNAQLGLTKEDIYQLLWGDSYHPLEDDNKIYVTIRRLRKIIGDNLENPKYILRKEDYYLWNSEFQFTRFQQKAFAEENAEV
jgi:hypothetical protein